MNIYEAINENKQRTWLIMLFFVLVIGLIGYTFGLYYGDSLFFFGFALILAGFSSLFSYYYSDAVILAISRAKKIEEADSPRLFHAVENLCIGAGLPRPKIYLIEDSAPNAMATGRDPQHASVIVTSGLLEKLDKLELEGVIAHELSHIKDYDIRLMSIVVILVGMVALLSDWFLRSMWGSRRRERSSGGIVMIIGLVAIILAPLVAQLLKLALSRQREYLADASAALLTRFPEGLARALEKINMDHEPLEVANTATAHLYIVNPLKDYHDKVAQLFSTHPPIAERISRLRSM